MSKTTPAQSKHSRSAARSQLRQASAQLQALYASPGAYPYALCLDLTADIWRLMGQCGTLGLNINSILSNNLCFGSRTGNAAIMGGFVYLVARYLQEGADSLGYYLTVLRSMAAQGRGRGEAELRLACENLKSLFFCPVGEEGKVPELKQLSIRAIKSLCHAFQSHAHDQTQPVSLDPQESFYHCALKTAKVSKLNQHNTIYKQVLLSYFRYLSEHRHMPRLDIFRLTSDALSPCLNAQDQQMTGFIIRKCYWFLAEYFKQPGFFIQDHVLQETTRKCLSMVPYCSSNVTVACVFDGLWRVGRVGWLVNGSDWLAIDLGWGGRKQTGAQYKQQSKSQAHYGGQFISMCKYLTSVTLHLCSSGSPPQLTRLLQSLKCQMGQLAPQTVSLLSLWNHVLNAMQDIKNSLLAQCTSRRNIVANRRTIAQTGTIAAVIEVVIGNSQFAQHTQGYYSVLTPSNAYLMLVREYVHAEPSTPTRLYSPVHHPHQDTSPQVLRWVQCFNRNIDANKYKYWQQLLMLGGYLLQVAGDVRVLHRVGGVVKGLIKCRKMVGYGMEGGDGKRKLAGLVEMLNWMLKSSYSTGRVQSDEEVLLYSTVMEHNQPITRTKSVLLHLQNEKQRLKAQLLICIYKQVVEPALPCLSTKPTPFQDVLILSLALNPMLEPQLGLQDRVDLKAISRQAMHAAEERVRHRCRYRYHRAVCELMMEYSNLVQQRQQEADKLKSVIVAYLQNYSQLYPQHKNEEGVELQHRPLARKSHHRRSSLLAKIPHTLPSSSQSNRSQYDSCQYDRLLYIDFMYWCVYYCQRKELTQLVRMVQAIMEDWLEGASIEEYLVGVIRAGADVELMAQCCNKLVYLSHWEGGSGAGERTKQKQPSQGSSQRGGVSAKLNIEFELSQASINISNICKILLPFCTLVHSIVSSSLPSGQSLLQTIAQSRPVSLGASARRPQRLLCCLTNMLSIAHNIGMQWQAHLASDAVVNVLCLYKIGLAYQYYGKWYAYYCYAEMVFLGYVGQGAAELEGIRDDVSAFEDENDQSRTVRHGDTAKMRNPVECYLVQVVKLYLGWLTEEEQLSLLTSSETNSIPLLRSILTVQKLQHMHPHRSLIRQLSGLIWSRHRTSEQSLLTYSLPILPHTQPIFHISPHAPEFKLRHVTEASLVQIYHRLLDLVIGRILSCLQMHGQVSEFRFLLMYSLVYALKARNMRAIVQGLRCYQTRIRHKITAKSTTADTDNTSNAGNNQNPQAEELPVLDMLSISDSVAAIMSVVHAEGLAKKPFDKFSKIVLGAGKRRTSLSYHVNAETIARLLGQGLGRCGELGAELLLFFGQHAVRSLSIGNQYLVYREYLSLKPEVPNFQKKKFHLLNDMELKQFMDRRLCAIMQGLQPERLPLDELQDSLIKQIRNVIGYSYRHAQILENMLGNLVSRVSDKAILQLSVLMLDHSYGYKKFIQEVEPIVLDGLHGKSNQTLLQTIHSNNKKYVKFTKQQYLPQHETKLQFLLSGKQKHPMSILYPLGPYLYALSTTQPLLVTTVDLTLFEDFISTVDTLIANNSRLLNSKVVVDNREWWRSRDRVDRAIGQVANSLGVEVWDGELPQQVLALAPERDPRLSKLVYLLMRNGFKDTNKVYAYAQACNLAASAQYVSQTMENMRGSCLLSDIYTKFKQPENLLLLTHPDYTLFPFEACPQIKQRAVYRIPALQYLFEQAKMGHTCRVINLNYSKYLVNSTNDLPDTEVAFYKIKDKFTKWSGMVGKKPTFEQFMELLDSQAFIYMGHGTGSGHLREKDFYGRSMECFMMLFGCSSASITLGKCQPYGIVHSHLLNGSPGVLGCLWEVTDKDTDKVTEFIFKNVRSSPQNFARLVSSAKKKCKQQYLNGGALVIFGIPTYVYCD